MKIFTAETLEQTAGSMTTIYGDTGSGKTIAALATAPHPILMITGERRAPARMIDFVKGSPNMQPKPRDDLRIIVATPAGFDDLMDYLCDDRQLYKEDGDRIFKTVLLDGISHFMSITLANEIANQHFESLPVKDQQKKKLTRQSKLTEEGYGTMADEMLRLINRLGALSQDGHHVIITALIESNPSYDRALVAAPLFAGRKFGKIFPGAMDLIGLVRPRVDGSNAVVYPPTVNFVSDGTFMAKMTGDVPGGPVQQLNFSRILGEEG